MKQLTNEIRLQIFQQNIGQNVTIENGSRIFKITGCDEKYVFIKDANGLGNTLMYCDLVLLKRPLSSITDEEAKEISKSVGGRLAKILQDYVEIHLHSDVWLLINFNGEI